MRKNLLVFCCVTLLTAILFGCNGVPALAASMKVKVTSVETNESKVTEKTTAKKKIDKKKAKKKKKSQKAVKIENYIKNGKFNYKSYGKAIGADTIALRQNLDFLIGEYLVEVNTNDQSTEKYYIGIGYQNKERTGEDFTFFAIFEEGWGRSIEYKDGLTLPYNGLIKLQEIVNYVKKQKNPNPYSAPKLDGFEWNDGSKFDELF